MSFIEPTGINPIPVFPLDPLTIAEMQLAVSIVQSDIRFIEDPRSFFDRVELFLPSKKVVLNFHIGDQLVRKAFVGTYSPTFDNYYQYIINLDDQNIKVTIVKCARPAWTFTDNNNL